MVPKTARPTAPLRRAKTTVEVAVPRSAGGTAFCAASSSTCSTRPMPVPRMAAYTPTVAIDVCVPALERSRTPTAITAPPATGNGL